METLKFGRSEGEFELPNLVDLQTRSYADYLQADTPFSERESQGANAAAGITAHFATLLRRHVPLLAHEHMIARRIEPA